ncbi:MAG: BatD family protein [Lacunisphaera sp.]
MHRFIHRLLFSSGGRRFPHRRSAPAWKPATTLLALLFPLGLFAQTVRWNPPGGQLGFNQISQLALVFEDCEPEGEPKLPTVDGLLFAGRPSQSSETSIVNFKMSRTFSYIYPVRANKRTTVTIPAFDIQTDKGTVKVAAARYTIGDAPVGSSGLSVDDVSSARLETPQKSVWAGEVFPVSYTLDVVRRYFHSLGTNVEWQPAPAVADDWTKPDPVETIVRNERRAVSVQTTQASIKQPGVYALKPASQLVNLMVGSTAFGPFSQPNVEQRQIDTNPLELTVKPLPPATADFSGAVGTFTFVSKVVPVTAAVGEPITWTLELGGTGNWPDITGLPQREVSNDFQVVQPKSKRTMKDGTLFEGTLNEDVVLVPTRAGTYHLPPVRFNYFDPKTGAYKTIATEPVTLTVSGVPTPVQPPANSGAPVQFSLAPASTAPAAALPAATAPVPPENLPRDPLATSAKGFVPMLLRPLVWTCLLSSVLGPLILWLVLAALRSRVRDPQRRRREARAALATVLGELRARANQTPAPAALLTAWQSHAAVLWEIPHAAPGTPLVQASVARYFADSASPWAALWSEADRALHSREASLPADWVDRAERAPAGGDHPRLERGHPFCRTEPAAVSGKD